MRTHRGIPAVIAMALVAGAFVPVSTVVTPDTYHDVIKNPVAPIVTTVDSTTPGATADTYHDV